MSEIVVVEFKSIDVMASSEFMTFVYIVVTLKL